MKKPPKKLQIYIDDLIHNVYCRIQPSRVHGVGVFAIRPIPKGASIFASLLPSREGKESAYIPKELIFDNPNIHENVKKMIHDFISIEDGHVTLPTFGLNELNISFYLNHSDKPNVHTEDGVVFYAKRDIQAGEELFSDYNVYTDETISYKKKKSL
jgi:uncharacterized protein